MVQGQHEWCFDNTCKYLPKLRKFMSLHSGRRNLKRSVLGPQLPQAPLVGPQHPWAGEAHVRSDDNDLVGTRPVNY